eukprot:548986-Prorocentrum_minimum.AAC.1
MGDPSLSPPSRGQTSSHASSPQSAAHSPPRSAPPPPLSQSVTPPSLPPSLHFPRLQMDAWGRGGRRRVRARHATHRFSAALGRTQRDSDHRPRVQCYQHAHRLLQGGAK